MRSWSAIFAATLLVLSAMAVAGRDGRQSLSVIWERDLGKLIHESPGAGAHHHAVFELKISDDDRWIGVDVVADRTTMWEGQHHHLLLLPLNSINNAFEQYEFQQSRGSEEDFFLSGDGGLVLIQDGPAIRLEDRRLHSSCSLFPADVSEVLSPGGFMNEGLFVATRWYPRSVHASARYEVYEPDCKLVGAWELKGGNPATTWPGEGHLFIRRYMTGTTWETLLVEWPSWKTINRWSFEKGGLVADAGRVLCGMFLSDHFQCRDMATEAPLANPLVVHYGKPMSTSRSGTLAFGTDWFALWKPFTEGEHWAHVKRQVLWDFRSGAVVDSWVPESQNGDPSSLRSMGPAIRPFPFMCSLSSTGAFLVEGGHETIRVFRVNRGMRSTR